MRRRRAHEQRAGPASMSSRRRSGAAARKKADDPETGKQHGVVFGLGHCGGKAGRERKVAGVAAHAGAVGSGQRERIDPRRQAKADSGRGPHLDRIAEDRCESQRAWCDNDAREIDVLRTVHHARDG